MKKLIQLLAVLALTTALHAQAPWPWPASDLIIDNSTAPSGVYSLNIDMSLAAVANNFVIYVGEGVFTLTSSFTNAVGWLNIQGPGTLIIEAMGMPVYVNSYGTLIYNGAGVGDMYAHDGSILGGTGHNGYGLKLYNGDFVVDFTLASQLIAMRVDNYVMFHRSPTLVLENFVPMSGGGEIPIIYVPNPDYYHFQDGAALMGFAFVKIGAETFNVKDTQSFEYLDVTYTIDFRNGSGIFLVAEPVPEPGTWALMAGGLGALALLRRRRG